MKGFQYEHADYDSDAPGGDEFDELLAAMQSCHDTEHLKQYTARIPELISAVRQARNECDAKVHFARQQQRALWAQAAALLLHNALREAWHHIRRGTQPDQLHKRRWQEALAGLAVQALLVLFPVLNTSLFTCLVSNPLIQV